MAYLTPIAVKALNPHRDREQATIQATRIAQLSRTSLALPYVGDGARC